ncbi:MAG: site-2 protease family protein [Armatimonadota bacterium]|nr:site-2 protease family protein [Armatimonadota bacterium]
MLGLSLATLAFRAIALLIAAPCHEFAHGYAADRLGDPTPRRAGRLTLNPLAHLDPLGTILLLLTGFGWAKPVPVDPAYFADWRRGLIAVAAAGPAANVILAILFGLPFKLGVVEVAGSLGRLLLMVVFINAVLAVFNLIPVPPLDGSKIMVGLLPGRLGIAYARLQTYGVLILIALIWFRITDLLVLPPLLWLVHLATGLGRV